MKTQTLKPIQHPPVDEALVEEIVRKIVSAFNPLRIVLFGSRARDRASINSDIDLFVEMETSLPVVDRRTEIRRLLWPPRCAVDILVYTPAEVAERRNVIGSIVRTIEREGKVLYERAGA